MFEATAMFDVFANTKLHRNANGTMRDAEISGLIVAPQFEDGGSDFMPNLKTIILQMHKK